MTGKIRGGMRQRPCAKCGVKRGYMVKGKVRTPSIEVETYWSCVPCLLGVMFLYDHSTKKFDYKRAFAEAKEWKP